MSNTYIIFLVCNDMVETSWCEVCQFEAKAETVEELLKIWIPHTETLKHQNNVIKYLQYDLGALTIDEIPEKLDEYIKNLGN